MILTGRRIAGKFIVFEWLRIKSGGIRIEGLSGLARTGNTKGATEPLQDFTVTAIVEQDSTENHQIRRVGFNLADQNGDFGLMFMNDNSQSVMNGICRVGLGQTAGVSACITMSRVGTPIPTNLCI
ncbi:hypothetical protein P7H19_21560 [Paenibacillus larvae]|nr:hypothetical protein [Paenibacillus larvae]MDT2238341.1 hypothetical protein [Paenibacillus larvae]